ncbi:MAG: diaminopimelate epimerase [Gammaproteobacteria bacterium]
MKLSFTKMQGLGNDFVVVDATRRPFLPTAEQSRHIADRRLGVGCDQILVIEPPSAPGAHFDYRIYNSDGSESGQCLNGARCVARFVRDHGLSREAKLTLRTRTTRIELQLLDGSLVRVDAGAPRLEPAQVPFTAPARALRYTVALDDGALLEVGAVSMGNPHAVIEVPDVEAAPVEAIGRALQRHPAFPERVNAGFLQVVDSGRAKLRVYERGAGETQACGSGACAALVAGRLWGRLGASVQMQLRGGVATMEWAGEGQPVYMTGPAATVYRGELDWNDRGSA